MDKKIIRMVAQALDNLKRAGTTQDYIPLSERLTLMREAEEILSDALAEYDKSMSVDMDEIKDWVIAIEDTVTDNYAEIIGRLDELEIEVTGIKERLEG